MLVCTSWGIWLMLQCSIPPLYCHDYDTNSVKWLHSIIKPTQSMEDERASSQPTWSCSTKCFILFSLLSENTLKQNFLQQIHPLCQNILWERLQRPACLDAENMYGKLSGCGSALVEACARKWIGSLKGKSVTAEQLRPGGNLDFWKIGVIILVGRTLIILLMLCPVWFFLRCLHWEREPVELYKAVSFPVAGGNVVLVVFLLLSASSASDRDAGLEVRGVW